MAEYAPCPWCSAHVTTAPSKAGSGDGSTNRCQPGVLWKRNGGKRAGKSCAFNVG
jgi:hypothetical protein